MAPLHPFTRNYKRGLRALVDEGDLGEGGVVGVGKDQADTEGKTYIGLRVPEDEMFVLCRDESQVVMAVSIGIMGGLGGTEVNVRQTRKA